jgi:hypothetical protein
MSIPVRCGRQMDGSGPRLVFSSPNCKLARPIETVLSEAPRKDDRLPLPSGHPVSWGLLTLGTVLEGSAYADAL